MLTLYEYNQLSLDEKAYTAYIVLAEKYHLLDKLVETFDLVSSTTGERMKIIDLTRFTE